MKTYALPHGQGIESESIGPVDNEMSDMGAQYYYDESYPRPHHGRTFARYYFLGDYTEVGYYIPDIERGLVHPHPRVWGERPLLTKLTF